MGCKCNKSAIENTHNGCRREDHSDRCGSERAAELRVYSDKVLYRGDTELTFGISQGDDLNTIIYKIAKKINQF